MQLAAYKGPAPTLSGKLVHLAICGVDTVRQSWKHRRLVVVRHSHCELVIQGRCYSASDRDGGVRGKVLAWFRDHDGDNYDWVGIARFVLPFLPHPARLLVLQRGLRDGAGAAGGVSADAARPGDAPRSSGAGLIRRALPRALFLPSFEHQHAVKGSAWTSRPSSTWAAA